MKNKIKVIMSAVFSRSLPKAVKEIRLIGCQTGNRSHGLRWGFWLAFFVLRFIDGYFIFLYFRQFIQSNYQTIKQSNPDLPVLVREATGAPARAFARFG